MKENRVMRATAPARERQRRSIIQPEPCPNGAKSFSPGLARSAYPGSTPQNGFNPNGVASSGARWMQPFQGWLRGGRVPRVARASQPWAERWNPVGIRETANHPSAPSDQSAAPQNPAAKAR